MKAVRIAYLTDVEGQWRKLAEFAADNPLVRLHGDTLSVQPGAIFVFGGDAIDRGAEAGRVLHTLVAAKRRQPSQVVLLAGNRDINKLRLMRELQGQFFYPLPDALRSADRGTLLRWIFRYTMNTPGGFDFRKAELHTDDDDAVVDSFFADVQPGGIIFQYLRAAQLAFRDSATLFVHGGITDESLGHIPGHARRIDSVDGWIDALNAWLQSQLDGYEAHAARDPACTGGNSLIAYQAPVRHTRRNQASVVYGRNSDDHNNPHLPDTATLRALTAAHIHRVVVGHTPMGDAPSVLQAPDFEIVFADNSYAPIEGGTRLLLDDHSLSMRARSRTADGEELLLDLSLARTREDTLIGRRDATTGHLIKGPATDGRFILQRYDAGFVLDQRAISADDLKTHGVV